MSQNEKGFCRTTRLEAMGAAGPVLEELLTYTTNPFDKNGGYPKTPLAEEPHIAFWREHLGTSPPDSAYEVLQKCVVQLQFPIREGISGQPDYLNVIKKGLDPRGLALASGLQLEQPDRVRVRLYASVAGEIPVITIQNRRDFAAVFNAVLCRNEPKPLPDSFGAFMIYKFTSGKRIALFRAHWEAHYPNLPWEPVGQMKLLSMKDQFRDHLIFLSEGPYSGVAGSTFGYAESQWLAISDRIRLDHESVHYFTSRFFGKLGNTMFDELMADYMGITSAVGHFRADWLLHFLGLEEYPNYRKGGRLQNYRQGLSDEAFPFLLALVKQSIESLALFDQNHQPTQDPNKRIAFLVAMIRLGLVELSAPNAQELLWETWQAALNQSGPSP